MNDSIRILFITLYFIYDILTKETKDKVRPYHYTRFFVILCYNQDAIPVFLSGRRQPAHITYTRNNMGQKCEGDCGLWVLNEINFFKYPENLKKIVGAVWKLPAK